MPPKQTDKAEMPDPGEVNVGWFWHNCKRRRRCNRSPVLRADYLTHRSGTRGRQPSPDEVSRTYDARV